MNNQGFGKQIPTPTLHCEDEDLCVCETNCTVDDIGKLSKIEERYVQMQKKQISQIEEGIEKTSLFNESTNKSKNIKNELTASEILQEGGMNKDVNTYFALNYENQLKNDGQNKVTDGKERVLNKLSEVTKLPSVETNVTLNLNIDGGIGASAEQLTMTDEKLDGFRENDKMPESKLQQKKRSKRNTKSSKLNIGGLKEPVCTSTPKQTRYQLRKANSVTDNDVGSMDVREEEIPLFTNFDCKTTELKQQVTPVRNRKLKDQLSYLDRSNVHKCHTLKRSHSPEYDLELETINSISEESEAITDNGRMALRRLISPDNVVTNNSTTAVCDGNIRSDSQASSKGKAKRACKTKKRRYNAKGQAEENKQISTGKLNEDLNTCTDEDKFETSFRDISSQKFNNRLTGIDCELFRKGEPWSGNSYDGIDGSFNLSSDLQESSCKQTEEKKIRACRTPRQKPMGTNANDVIKSGRGCKRKIKCSIPNLDETVPNKELKTAILSVNNDNVGNESNKNNMKIPNKVSKKVVVSKALLRKTKPVSTKCKRKTQIANTRRKKGIYQRKSKRRSSQESSNLDKLNDGDITVDGESENFANLSLPTPTVGKPMRLSFDANLDVDACSTNSSSDSDEDLPEGLTPLKYEKTITENDLVWVKRNHLPHLPALVKKVYRRKKRLTCVFFAPIDNPEKSFTLSYGSSRNVVPFCNPRKEEFMKGNTTMSKTNQEYFQACIQRMEEFLTKKALKKLKDVWSFFSDEDLDLPEEKEEEMVNKSSVTDTSEVKDKDDCQITKVVKMKGLSKREQTRKRKMNEKTQPLTDFLVSDESKEYLKKIFKKQIPSDLHHRFMTGTTKERMQMKHRGFGPIDEDEQIESILMTYIRWLKELTNNPYLHKINYVFDVWVPEAIVNTLKVKRKYTTKRAWEVFHKGVRMSKAELQLIHEGLIEKCDNKEEPVKDATLFQSKKLILR